MGKIKDNLIEGKRNIIANLIEEYDIQTVEYIQDALKDLQWTLPLRNWGKVYEKLSIMYEGRL